MSVTSAVPGQTTLTYTIVVGNNGPSDVTGATVTDSFVANLTNVALFIRSVGGQQLRNVAAEAPAGGNDPLRVLGKELGVHPWFVVEPFEVGA